MSQSKEKPTWPLGVRVEVEFFDSCASGRWRTVADHRKDSHPSLCRSVGYLLERTARHVTVAQSISSNSQDVADTMSIPLAAVRSIKRLR
jgi:hypothetical protein